jgi:hypothetical protein
VTGIPTPPRRAAPNLVANFLPCDFGVTFRAGVLSCASRERLTSPREELKKTYVVCRDGDRVVCAVGPWGRGGGRWVDSEPYTDAVTADARHYDDLHRLVDRLEPVQADAVRAVAQLVAEGDDIDDGDAVATVTFVMEGASYEIDLREEHAAQLRDALAAFVTTARRVGARKRPRRRFSFAGSISAEPDFAARSEDILDEIARRDPA